MASKAVSFFIALCSLVVAKCPTASCGSLTADVCAQQTTTTAYTISTNSCSSSNTCSAANYVSLISQTSVASKVLSCSVTPTTSIVAVTWVPVSCPTKATGKDWLSGGTLLLCSTDSDCLMTDKTYTTCVCVPRSDSNGVCLPNPSNQAVFGIYWADCGLTNIISDQLAYNYWTYALQNWVYTQSDLSCMNIFYEVQTYNSLYNTYLSAADLGVTLVLLLFLE